MKRLEVVKVLVPENPNHSTALFGGKASGILNWNDIPYPHFYELREEIRGLFWRASEIDTSGDVKQFPTLPEKTQKAFLEILGGMLSSLDAPQTDIASRISQFSTDPSVVSIMATIADQEAEHNHSYSYILSSMVSLKTQIESFEVGRTNPVILKRNERLMKIYNQFSDNPTIKDVLETLIYSAIMEGLFFYSAFAFFYNLARHNQMVATSTMISYINRDELQHGRFISELFRATLGENPELNTPEFTSWVYEQFEDAVEQETLWCEHILTGVDGIDLYEMKGYIKYRANKMLRLLGLSEIFEGYNENSMKWIKAYADNFDDTKTDFFEQRNRQYVKVSSDNGFNELLGDEPESDLNGFEDL